MKKIFILLAITCFSVSFSQVNKFKDDKCGLEFVVTYVQNADGSINLNYEFTLAETKTLIEELPQPNDFSSMQNKTFLTPIVNETFSQIHYPESITVKNYNPATKVVTYEIRRGFSKKNFMDNNPLQKDVLYDQLNAYLKGYGRALTCSKIIFINNLESDLKGMKNSILSNDTEENQYKNKNIFPIIRTVEKNDNTNEDYLYNKDVRNPIAFTNFIVRNPRANGKSTLIRPSNLSSYNYIRPGSLINILFIKEVYDQLNTVKVKISAYLMRRDETVIPVNINGFHEVELVSNKDAYKSKATKNTDNTMDVNYSYSIRANENYPIQSEINTEMLNPQPGDKLYVTVKNTGDNNASFTTVFEFEDFGWTSQATGGFAWIKTITSGPNDYIAGGTSAYNFHYKTNRGGNFFFGKLINPSFGPELVVLQDSSQKTLVGLGISVSTLMRTLKVGYGWYLNGNNGKPYVSIGVNFVEGYQAISSILNNVKTSP